MGTCREQLNNTSVIAIAVIGSQPRCPRTVVLLKLYHTTGIQGRSVKRDPRERPSCEPHAHAALGAPSSFVP